jgi:type I restriction enzyme, S subunit
MPPGWRIVTVDEIKSDAPRAVAIGPFGSRMKADRYVSQGVPVIRGQNITATRSLRGEFVFVSEHTAGELKSCLVYPGDLVFPHRGAIGEVGIVPATQSESAVRFMLSTSLMKLTCNRDVVDPDFVFYFFRSDLGRQEILTYSSTVGTPGIGQPLTSLRSMRLPLPPLAEQHAIAETLGALDDKIEANSRLCDLVEQILWASYSRSAASAPRAPLATLSPPVLGGTPARDRAEYWKPQVPWASARDVASAKHGLLLQTAEQISELATRQTRARVAPAGSVVLTARGTVGACVVTGTDLAFNQSCYGFVPQAEIGSALLYCTVLSSVTEARRAAHGSVFDTITMETLRAVTVPDPRAPALKRLSAELDELITLGFAVMRESQTLSALRDALLPGLLSGELRVREAESLVEDAV